MYIIVDSSFRKAERMFIFTTEALAEEARSMMKYADHYTVVPVITIWYEEQITEYMADLY